MHFFWIARVISCSRRIEFRIIRGDFILKETRPRKTTTASGLLACLHLFIYLALNKYISTARYRKQESLLSSFVINDRLL